MVSVDRRLNSYEISTYFIANNREETHETGNLV